MLAQTRFCGHGAVCQPVPRTSLCWDVCRSSPGRRPCRPVVRAPSGLDSGPGDTGHAPVCSRSGTAGTRLRDGVRTYSPSLKLAQSRKGAKNNQCALCGFAPWRETSSYSIMGSQNHRPPVCSRKAAKPERLVFACLWLCARLFPLFRHLDALDGRGVGVEKPH